VSVYARNRTFTADDWAQLHRFAGTFSIKVEARTGIPVAYLGMWDSVKAAGILRWNLRWPHTRQVPNALRVRHAVSIDEKRTPYREYLITPGEQPTLPDSVEQVWFAGVHSDVGGTFEDDPRLATVALKWVVDGALAPDGKGLLLKPGAYRHAVTVDLEYALGRVHRMGWVWALLTYRRRRLPPHARVHACVRARVDEFRDYGSRIPRTAAWADEDWLTARE
jgi:hypothetical protein